MQLAGTCDLLTYRLCKSVSLHAAFETAQTTGQKDPSTRP